MSLPAARVGDLTSGHQAYPPRAIEAGAGTVFINGKAAARKTDILEEHCVGTSCHKLSISTGSGTVFIEGLEAARLTDETECGEAIVIGSADVNIG